LNKITGKQLAGFIINETTFTYDGKGQLIRDGYSRMRLSDYNYHNLPLNITSNSSSVANSYDSNGERVVKNGDYYLRDYAGRELAIYDNSADTLKSVNFYGNGMFGRYLADEAKSTYFSKDHLGTIRTTMNENGGHRKRYRLLSVWRGNYRQELCKLNNQRTS
jgi:hypothetical protein